MVQPKPFPGTVRYPPRLPTGESVVPSCRGEPFDGIATVDEVAELLADERRRLRGVTRVLGHEDRPLMPEEQLYKTEAETTRADIAAALRDAADEIESGDVRLGDGAKEQTVTVPERPRFEVELERLTDSETGAQRYELEYEIRWTK